MLSSSSRMPDTHRREAPSSALAAYPASLCPKFLVFSPPLRNWRGGGGASGPPCPERSGRVSWRKSRIFEPFNFPVASTRPLRLRFCVCGIPLMSGSRDGETRGTSRAFLSAPLAIRTLVSFSVTFLGNHVLRCRWTHKATSQRRIGARTVARAPARAPLKV